MDYSVDLFRLQELGGNLSGCADNLQGALEALAEPGAGLLGTGVLDEACVEFQESWHTGLDQIRECTEALVEGVALTHQSYAAAEHTLSQMFQRIASDVASGRAEGPPLGGSLETGAGG